MARTYRLLEQHHRLPWQAIPCGLDNIKPIDSGTTWSRRSQEMFRLLAEDKEGLVTVKRSVEEIAAVVKLYIEQPGQGVKMDVRKALINLEQAAEATEDTYYYV